MGNTRVAVTDDGTVKQTNSYYPFGMLQGGETQQPQTGDNKYLYNGKELDADIGLYDYGARFYDAQLGRFHTLDPAADLLECSSPYVYSLNNPINFIDEDGELPIYIKGRISSDAERGNECYWASELLNTIRGSGIANPGGEEHFVDGDRTTFGKYWADGGYVFGNDPFDRRQAGKTFAYRDFENILSKLKRDPNSGKIIEKIQIYTHSRGAAFGAGYTAGLLHMIKEYADQFADPQNVIDFVLHLAPHQSYAINSPLKSSFSIDHEDDWLSGNDMGGLSAAFTSGVGDGVGEAHSNSSFVNEVKTFLSSFQENGGAYQNTTDDFIKKMKQEYNIEVTVK